MCKFKVKCLNGNKEIIYKLNNPDEVIYTKKVGRTTFEHSEDYVLLVLPSLEYNENDYIRSYKEFIELF